MADRPEGRGRPLTREELRDRPDIAPSGERPKPPRWHDLSVPRRTAFEPVERGGEDGSRLAAHRPAWVGASFKPNRARLRPEPRLEHRGRPVRPLYVWGKDDRAVYADTRYPWGCVCKVLPASGGGGGSGVLVGPRHVLTASHVVDWNGGATVEVHRAGSLVSAVSPADRGLAYTKVGSVTGSTVDEDYAVLVTVDRLGDQFGWLGVRTYDGGWDDEDYWWTIGYPGDVAGFVFPTWQRFKELDEDELDFGSGRAMTTSADVRKGQSGSPMFGFWDDGPYVVAVVSAESEGFFSGQENWCAGGSDLTRLVKYARDKYP